MMVGGEGAGERGRGLPSRPPPARSDGSPQKLLPLPTTRVACQQRVTDADALPTLPSPLCNSTGAPPFCSPVFQPLWLPLELLRAVGRSSSPRAAFNLLLKSVVAVGLLTSSPGTPARGSHFDTPPTGAGGGGLPERDHPYPPAAALSAVLPPPLPPRAAMTTPYAHSADGGALKTTLHLAHLAAAAAYTTVMAIDCAAAIKTGGGWPLYFLAVGTVGTSMASSLVFAVVKGAVVTLGWAELPTVAVAALWWSIGFVCVATKGPPPSVRIGAAAAAGVVWVLLGAVLHDRVVARRESAKRLGAGGETGGEGVRLAPDADVEAVA